MAENDPYDKAANLLKIHTLIVIILFFCLLLHRLSVRISLPFYDFLEVIIILIQVYKSWGPKQLGDPAPVNGLSLWTC